MMQGYFDEGIAMEVLDLISLGVVDECPLNSLGKHAEQFITFQNMSRVFLAGDDSTQLGHEIRQERILHESGMDEEARISSCILHDQMKCHHAVPRHEAAMDAGKHASALLWDVFHPGDFNPPVPVGQEVEKSAAIGGDVRFVH